MVIGTDLTPGNSRMSGSSLEYIKAKRLHKENAKCCMARSGDDGIRKGVLLLKPPRNH